MTVKKKPLGRSGAMILGSKVHDSYCTVTVFNDVSEDAKIAACLILNSACFFQTCSCHQGFVSLDYSDMFSV